MGVGLSSRFEEANVWRGIDGVDSGSELDAGM